MRKMTFFDLYIPKDALIPSSQLRIEFVISGERHRIAEPLRIKEYKRRLRTRFIGGKHRDYVFLIDVSISIETEQMTVSGNGAFEYFRINAENPLLYTR